MHELIIARTGAHRGPATRESTEAAASLRFRARRAPPVTGSQEPAADCITIEAVAMQRQVFAPSPPLDGPAGPRHFHRRAALSMPERDLDVVRRCTTPLRAGARWLSHQCAFDRSLNHDCSWRPSCTYYMFPRWRRPTRRGALLCCTRRRRPGHVNKTGGKLVGRPVPGGTAPARYLGMLVPTPNHTKNLQSR
jgi:hypothetical protein